MEPECNIICFACVTVQLTPVLTSQSDHRKVKVKCVSHSSGTINNSTAKVYSRKIQT